MRKVVPPLVGYRGISPQGTTLGATANEISITAGDERDNATTSQSRSSSRSTFGCSARGGDG